MQVRSLVAHHSSDGAEHAEDATYELAGIELELRMKDRIVAPVALDIAHVREVVSPANPEE